MWNSHNHPPWSCGPPPLLSQLFFQRRYRFPFLSIPLQVVVVEFFGTRPPPSLANFLFVDYVVSLPTPCHFCPIPCIRCPSFEADIFRPRSLSFFFSSRINPVFLIFLCCFFMTAPSFRPLLQPRSAIFASPLLPLRNFSRHSRPSPPTFPPPQNALPSLFSSEPSPCPYNSPMDPFLNFFSSPFFYALPYLPIVEKTVSFLPSELHLSRHISDPPDPPF